ncbi:MAG TPA: SDR family NAD(P)-dependent oxidoreductase [Thermoanaerobaculia bacterium]|nr:SDR family NAD(P)-dependent oxidoreductase [Thermoanaerobaculia bacterium]
MQIANNTILITGGATGIGLALARALVERGNEAIICGRRRERLEEAQREVPALHIRQADVASADDRAALVAWLAETHPRTNVLVNNAGVQHRVDLTDEENLRLAEEEIAVNLLAPIHLTAQMLPLLRRNEPAAIINVSSGLAFAPLAHMPVYCATKAAVHSLTMSLRHQLRDTGVRVFEAIPPLVRSELGAWHRPAEMNRIAMSAEDAVNELLQGLEQDEFEIAIGGAKQSREKREAMFDILNARR